MMPLESPKLDDRTFDDLVAEAKRRISERSPEWTDRTDSDPGIVLLELFAFLTDTLLYRLNRVPEKVYVELLKLMGVTLVPPAAASAALFFERLPGGAGRIDIPRGTRVGAGRLDSGMEPVVFTTDKDAFIPDDGTSVEVSAHHAELIAAEVLGTGTGLAGATFSLRRPPVVASTGDDGDLVIAIELAPDEPKPESGGLEHGGRRYRIWREVETFVGRESEHVYRADRQAGLVHFAPAVRRTVDPGPRSLAAVPGADRQILAWYRRGGGPNGNVAPGSLTVLKDPVPGVRVTNREAAQGGRDVETLENALLRGPQEIHSLQRAVTARDYELVALASDRAVARAMALNSASYWRHALPGEAEVVLVPDAAHDGGRVDADTLRSLERPAVAARVLAELDGRRPLGSRCRVAWAKYKTVHVTARVVIHQHEDLQRLENRVLKRLNDTITPLPSGERGGWEFGKSLRASHVYEIALREAGVVWVDRVRMLLDEVPGGEVTALAAAPTQDGIWYAASAAGLFRTINDGVGWEPLAAGRLLHGERVISVCTHPTVPGLLAAVTRFGSSSAGDEGEAGESGSGESGSGEGAMEGPAGAGGREAGAGGVEAGAGRAEAGAGGTEAGEPDVGGGRDDGPRSRVWLSHTAGEDWAPHPHDLGFKVEDAAWLASDDTQSLLLATGVGLFRLSTRAGAGPELVPVSPQRQDLPLYAVASGDAGDGNAYVAVAAQRTAGVYLAAGFPRERSFRRIDLRDTGSLAGEDVRVLAIQRDSGASMLWAGTTAHGRADLGKGCFRWRLRSGQDAPEGWEAFSEGWRAGSCLGLAFVGAVVHAATYRRGVAHLDTRSPTPTWETDINSGLPRSGDDDFPVQPVGSVAARSTAGVEIVMAGTDEGVFRARGAAGRFTSVSGSEFVDRVTLPPSWLFCSGAHQLEVVRTTDVQERAEGATDDEG